MKQLNFLVNTQRKTQGCPKEGLYSHCELEDTGDCYYWKNCQAAAEWAKKEPEKKS